jgi:hypothetical protein
MNPTAKAVFDLAEDLSRYAQASPQVGNYVVVSPIFADIILNSGSNRADFRMDFNETD